MKENVTEKEKDLNKELKEVLAECQREEKNVTEKKSIKKANTISQNIFIAIITFVIIISISWWWLLALLFRLIYIFR